MEKTVITEFDKLISDSAIINKKRKKNYNQIIEELEEENENLASNMPWNTTEQATEIQVTDAAKYSKNKLELFGNTEQASYTGKNLFNYNDLLSKIQEFTISGNQQEFTISGNTKAYLYPMSLTGQYTISGIWRTTSGNGNFAVVYEDDSVDVIFQAYNETSESGTINFTTDISKNIKGFRFKTYGNRDFTFINLQVEQGSTATDYEPYVRTDSLVPHQIFHKIFM